jgi:hypothetical protein
MRIYFECYRALVTLKEISDIAFWRGGGGLYVPLSKPNVCETVGRFTAIMFACPIKGGQSHRPRRRITVVPEKRTAQWEYAIYSDHFTD